MISTHLIDNNRPTSSVPSSDCPHITSDSDQITTFDGILLSAASTLPPPGPDYYAARRELWLTPRPLVQRCQSAPSTAHQRLERLLGPPGAIESETVWKNGVEKIWGGLAAGGNLKRRLPMALIIRIVHAAWIRDQTWPVGAIAPEPDDILVNNQAPPTVLGLPSSPNPSLECSSGITTPWMVVNDDDNINIDEDEDVTGKTGR